MFLSDWMKNFARNEALQLAREAKIPDEKVRDTISKMRNSPVKEILIEEYLNSVPLDDKDLVEAELRGG